MRPASRSEQPEAPAVSTREVHGFVLQESRHLAGYRGSEHRHSRPFFSCVIEGELIERTRRGTATYGAGSVHFHDSADPHAGEAGDRGLRCFMITPGDRLASRLGAAAGDAAIDAASPLLASFAARCYRGFVARDAASDLECEAAALELVAAHLRMRTPRESTAPGWLFVARDYLHAHSAAPVTLAELSAVSGVHPVHMARVFRQILGITPAEYVRRLRLEHACQALATSDLPIADVALAAGYASQSHLTRAFRAHTGSTPAAYRRVRRPHR
jgi:AraC family transcriptional regulator